jgi:hypothetical protein
MFVLGQPKIKGAVQMIINPVALWWVLFVFYF